MIKHIIKIIWNKKSSNALLLLEILLAFLVLAAVLSFVFYNTDRLSSPLGFETENRKYITFGELNDLDSTQRVETLALLKRSLEELDLVEQVAYSNPVGPFANSNYCHGNDDNGYDIQACYAVVDHSFVTTSGMKIIEGRDFLEDDYTAAYSPIIFNKHFMDEFYPEQSMIDSVIQFQGNEMKIVGVIEEYKYNGEFEESDNRALLLYTPALAGFIRLTKAYLKMNPAADIAYEEKISKTIESVLKTPSFTIQDAPLLRKRTNLETWIPMYALLGMCIFLCINVALGLFGVLSYSISKRRSEVGLRRALGASGAAIAQQFTLEIIILTAFAILIGIVFAIQIPLLNFFDVDSSIFYRGILYSSLIILIVVTVCALYPSIQAARIHPALALHED